MTRLALGFALGVVVTFFGAPLLVDLHELLRVGPR